MNIGAAVKSVRVGKSLSQEQLAEAVGITQGAIAHIESNRNHPSTKRLERIALALEVSLLQLMEVAESMGNEPITPAPLEPEVTL